MSLIGLDLDLHRFAGLSNILNFWDVNLYNSLTFQLISRHLGGFLFGKTNSIFHKNFIEIGLVVSPKTQKKHAWVRNFFWCFKCSYNFLKIKKKLLKNNVLK